MRSAATLASTGSSSSVICGCLLFERVNRGSAGCLLRGGICRLRVRVAVEGRELAAERAACEHAAATQAGRWLDWPRAAKTMSSQLSTLRASEHHEDSAASFGGVSDGDKMML
jgi:hypothetical protein